LVFINESTEIIVAFRNFAYAPKICLCNDNTFCSMSCENSLNAIIMETNCVLQSVQGNFS
jgi:hypothetical protein